MNQQPLKCVVIDDEIAGRVVLRELLAKHCPDITIAAEAPNASEGARLIRQHLPDFVLLDIQMPGGSGLDMLEEFGPVFFDVIFVTSYDRYAISAIKFSAVDYLLKPVDVKELTTAIDKVRIRKTRSQQPGELIVNLLSNINENSEKKVTVHVGDKVKFINVGEIVCLEASSNYTLLSTADRQTYRIPRVLKDFDDFLPKDKPFIRINKSSTINAAMIDKYSKGEPCIIIMKNGKEFEVSRRKKAEINEFLKSLSVF